MNKWQFEKREAIAYLSDLFFELERREFMREEPGSITEGPPVNTAEMRHLDAMRWLKGRVLEASHFITDGDINEPL